MTGLAQVANDWEAAPGLAAPVQSPGQSQTEARIEPACLLARASGPARGRPAARPELFRVFNGFTLKIGLLAQGPVKIKQGFGQACGHILSTGLARNAASKTASAPASSPLAKRMAASSRSGSANCPPSDGKQFGRIKITAVNQLTRPTCLEDSGSPIARRTRMARAHLRRSGSAISIRIARSAHFTRVDAKQALGIALREPRPGGGG